MTEFQILSAIRDSRPSIRYVDLLTLGLKDQMPNGQLDKLRLKFLLSEGYISGRLEPNARLSITPKGVVLLDELEKSFNQQAQKIADEVAKEKSKRKFSIMLTVLGEVIAFALGFLLRVLVG